MKLKIAVCDDDLQWSERIRQSISEYMCHVNQQCDIQVFESGEELCGAFHGSHSFDIVFLDVDMDEMDGMETAEMIRSRSDQVTIVFITGVVEAAPRGYQYGAMRYIMKQDIEELLPECLGSFLKQYSGMDVSFNIKFLTGVENVNLSQLVYVESKARKLCYMFADKVLELYDNITTAQKQLEPYGFVRIHQSFLVNMKYIQKISSYRVYLTTHKDLPATKARYQEVKDQFFEYIEYDSEG